MALPLDRVRGTVHPSRSGRTLVFRSHTFEFGHESRRHCNRRHMRTTGTTRSSRTLAFYV